MSRQIKLLNQSNTSYEFDCGRQVGGKFCIRITGASSDINFGNSTPYTTDFDGATIALYSRDHPLSSWDQEVINGVPFVFSGVTKLTDYSVIRDRQFKLELLNPTINTIILVEILKE